MIESPTTTTLVNPIRTGAAGSNVDSDAVSTGNDSTESGAPGRASDDAFSCAGSLDRTPTMTTRPTVTSPTVTSTTTGNINRRRPRVSW